ncbi:MAG TPA: hypothetical protein VF006_30640 [Longimicrobium sp.]
MSGPYPTWDPQLVPELQPRPVRRPDIDTIVLFFEKNTVPKAPVGGYQMNYELFSKNEQVYFEEFKKRVQEVRGTVTDEQVEGLWKLIVDCFKQKDVKLAHAFLEYAAKIGLQPLQAPSERIFWSGTNSRAHAYKISQPPPKPTALETTDIGRLLDKLSVFKAVPWELSTLLWALVSRYFGMGATGDIHVYLDGGFAIGNVFWNDELPVLRLMQRYGAVRNIVIHIWHTKESRWLREFAIDSDKLLLVYDKGKRIPAPTLDNQNATRSHRFDKPVKLAPLRRFFEHFMQSTEREHPLVLYDFRKETCIYARPERKSHGLEIKLFEYGSEQAKTLTVVETSAEKAFERLPVVEKFLMANYRLFVQLPAELAYRDDAFLAGTSILALKAGHEWRYRLAFVRDFRCTGQTGVQLLGDAIKREQGQFLRTRYAHHTAQTVGAVMQQFIGELFDGPQGLQMDPANRIAFLRHIWSCKNT